MTYFPLEIGDREIALSRPNSHYYDHSHRYLVTIVLACSSVTGTKSNYAFRSMEMSE